jgi:predicted RNase H-like HicB family nuclease
VEHRIELRQTDEGFSVSVPGLPGCWSQGATEAEALENIEVAIAEYLEVRQGVERGIADADAGRVVPGDQVMAWLDRRR